MRNIILSLFISAMALSANAETNTTVTPQGTKKLNEMSYQFSLSGADGTIYGWAVDVYQDGDTYYFSNLFPQYKDGNYDNFWVKGARSGNTITIPSQKVWERGGLTGSTSYSVGLLTDETSLELGDYTLTVNEDGSISGNASDQFALVYDMYGSKSAKALTWAMNLTEVTTPTDLVTVPAEAKHQTAHLNYGLNARDIDVAILGNDFYFQGLGTSSPTAWAKGTYNPETKQLTLPQMQFQGTESRKVLYLNPCIIVDNTVDPVVYEYGDGTFDYDTPSKTFIMSNGTGVSCLLAETTSQRKYADDISSPSIELTEDIPTAITTVNANVDVNADVNYNLVGQKVSKNVKGLIISNNKKILK